MKFIISAFDKPLLILSILFYLSVFYNLTIQNITQIQKIKVVGFLTEVSNGLKPGVFY
jgi:hypothetical protein